MRKNKHRIDCSRNLLGLVICIALVTTALTPLVGAVAKTTTNKTDVVPIPTSQTQTQLQYSFLFAEPTATSTVLSNAEFTKILSRELYRWEHWGKANQMEKEETRRTDPRSLFVRETERAPREWDARWASPEAETPNVLLPRYLARAGTPHSATACLATGVCEVD